MNSVKLNVYKKVLQEVCEKFDGVDEFTKDKIEEICCNEKLSMERGHLFCLWRIATTFKAKLVVLIKKSYRVCLVRD